MSPRASCRIAAAFLATTGLVGVTTDAFAQVIEEIVVTTRKRAENLQDVPIVITAFTAEALQRKGINDLEDIAKFTTGISFDEGFSKQDTRITVRGLSPSRGRQNVAVLFDDVDISSEAISSGGGSMFINPRLFDTERVEVVKGPHSALFGRSAFAGAINYISRKPGDIFQANGTLEIASYNKQEGRVSVSGPVIEDLLSIGGAVGVWHSNGFYRNSVSGKNIGGNDGHGASASAVLTPSDALKFTLRSEFSKDHFDPEARTFINPQLNVLQIPASAIGQGIPGITSGTTTTAAVLGKIPDAERLPPPRLSRNPRTGLDYPGIDRRLENVMLRTEYEMDAVELVSLSYYGNSDLTQFHDTLTTGDATVVNAIQEAHFVTENRVLNQDLRLQSNDEESRLQWTVGGLFWHEVTRQEGRSNACVSAPAGNCATLLAGLGVSRPFYLNNTPGYYLRDTHHYSLYGIGGYDITDDLQFEVEIRHSWENEKVESSVNTTSFGCSGLQRSINLATGVLSCLVPAPQSTSPVRTVFANGQTTAGTKTLSEFTTPRFTLNYKLTEDQLLYASAGNGRKPGGVLSIVSPSVVNGVPDYSGSKYREENLWVYELGVKADWFDGRLRTNADVYYQDFKFKQESGTRTGTDGLPIPGAGFAERARVYGFEMDATAAITEELTVGIGYSYVDSKYKSFTLQQTTAANIARAGNCTVVRPANGTPYCNVDYAGKRLALSPKHSGNWTIGYTKPVWNDTEFFAEADGRYMGQRFTTFDNDTTLNSFVEWNARLGFRTDRWTIMGYVNNLFDNDALKTAGVALPDFTNGFIIPTSPGLPSGFLGNLPDKRQFGLRVSFAFDGDAAPRREPAAAPPAPAPARPAPPPAAAPVRQAPPAPAVPQKFLVFFDWDRSNLRADASQIVSDAATYAKANGKTRIETTGHADTSGTNAYNLGLSQRRAEAVKAELVRLGIPANEIVVLFKGEESPLVATGDGVREPQNRRVEIIME